MAQAGADKADPLARYVVDDEFGDLAYKEPSFADMVMFWHKPQAPQSAGTTNAAIGDEVKPLDASAEAERVKALTGNQPIIIAQRKATKSKLPGL